MWIKIKKEKSKVMIEHSVNVLNEAIKMGGTTLHHF